MLATLLPSHLAHLQNPDNERDTLDYFPLGENQVVTEWAEKTEMH